MLTIRGERNAEVKNEDAKEVRHVETFHGKYERSLRLPSEVDADGVKAVVPQRHPDRDAAQGAAAAAARDPGDERLVINHADPSAGARRPRGRRAPLSLLRRGR